MSPAPAICSCFLALVLVGCTPNPGVISDLDVQNLSVEAVYVDYGLYFEIPPGTGGFVASFSGPEPAAWEVPIYRADCSLLEVVTWERGHADLTLRVNSDLTTQWIPGSVDPLAPHPESTFRTLPQCPS
jgi:hypothetical protein